MTRPPHEAPTAIPVTQLEAGVRDGIITQPQLEMLLARSVAQRSKVIEPRRGFNAVTIAYWSGAIAVLFALGWFLVERWARLGAPGVLLVGVVYAASFAGASRWLMRQGYRTAASFTAVLVVATVPVITWSALKLLGLWYESSTLYATKIAPDARASTRWIPLDIATIVAGLLVLRIVRFPLLTAAVSVGFWYLALHAAPLVIGGSSAVANEGWTVLGVGAIILLSGFVIERRQRHKAFEETAEDFAFWPFVVGLAALGLATLELWARHRAVVPHAMLAAGVMSVIVSLRMRRREFLVAGAIGFVGYLAWLAFDVFRQTLGFPIVLAGFGLVVILLAVWVQRRFPELIRRVSPQAG